MKADEMPSLERLEELLEVDAESPSGLRWRVSRGSRAPAGGVAGSLNHDGYWHVQVDGKKLLAHRIVWMLANQAPIPEGKHIDHRDGCRGNNRPENLRLATNQQNQRNRGAHRDNTSGVKGVYWDARRGKWRADICVDGKNLTLGRFTDKPEAIAARQAAEIRYFGEFRRAA